MPVDLHNLLILFLLRLFILDLQDSYTCVIEMILSATLNFDLMTSNWVWCPAYTWNGHSVYVHLLVFELFLWTGKTTTSTDIAT